MKKNIIIATIAIVVLVGLVLILLESANPDFKETELSLVTELDGVGVDNANIMQSEAMFLQQIQQLQSITFANSNILQDPGFKQLTDYTITLKPVPAGRNNPFNPIALRDALNRASDLSRGQSVQLSESRNETVLNIENTESNESLLLDFGFESTSEEFSDEATELQEQEGSQ